MKVYEFKKLLDTYPDDIDIIFACENCFCEYDAECGSFRLHTDLDDEPFQLIFTINNKCLKVK